jgi:hypothetical protein
MAEVKISALPPAATALLTDKVPITDPTDLAEAPSGTTKFMTNQQIVDIVGSSLTPEQEPLVVTIDGQTAFTLSATPSGVDAISTFLNGQFRPQTDYSFVGTAFTWGDPGGLTLKTTDTLIVWYNFSSPGGAIASVFGRTGMVVAVASDYDASQVDNDSGVAGAFTSDALNTLNAQSGVTSVFGRTGAVSAVLNDYDASEVNNDSGVSGANVALALDNLEAAIPISFTKCFLPDTNSNDGNHRIRTIGASANFNLEFAVPNDFNALVSIEVIISPTGGGGGSGKDLDLSSSYGNIGETTNFHSETDTTSTYDFGTAGEFKAIDVSSVFSLLSANDICGLNWDNNSVGGTINIYAIKLIYTR